MNKSPRYEFLSPEWFIALQAMLMQAVDAAGDLDGVRWSACEVFTDLPPHLLQGGNGSIAWHYYLVDGVVQFGYGEREDVDFRAVLDYGTARELARIVVGGDEAARQEMESKAIAAIQAGKGQMFGSRDNRPAQLANYHDALARMTR